MDLDVERVDAVELLGPEHDEADFGHRPRRRRIAMASFSAGVVVYVATLLVLPWADHWLETATHAAPWPSLSASPFGAAGGIGVMLGFVTGAVVALALSGPPNDVD